MATHLGRLSSPVIWMTQGMPCPYAGGERVAVRENGTLYWLLADHLGSTAKAANGATQVGELRYKAWGETRYSSGNVPTTYRFTGQREDGTIGLYFYKARYYDPALGRFVQPDPIVPGTADMPLAALTVNFSNLTLWKNSGGRIAGRYNRGTSLRIKGQPGRRCPYRKRKSRKGWGSCDGSTNPNLRAGLS